MEFPQLGEQRVLCMRIFKSRKFKAVWMLVCVCGFLIAFEAVFSYFLLSVNSSMYFKYELEQYEKGIPHNEASVSFAREILPESGYDENETEDICSAILFHRHSCKSEHSTLGMLLRKADKLSRRCYECTAKNECYWDEYSKNPGLEY